MQGDNKFISDVLIIGGGISGLTAAYRLVDAGLKVVLMEAEEELGGLAGAVLHRGYSIEKLYHHLFDHDECAIELLRELNLCDNLVFQEARTGFFFDGQWYEVSKPLNLLTFKPLSFWERIKLGLAVLQSKQEKNPGRLDDLSVEQWLGLKEGSRMKLVFDRLTRGKLGIGVEEVSAAFLCGRFRGRARTRKLTSRGERFGYLMGSLSSLIDALLERVDKSGNARMLTSCSVDRIEKVNGGFLCISDGGDEYRVRTVLSTIPPHLFAQASKFFDEQEVKALEEIRYCGVICTVFGLNRSLSDFYWGTVCDPSLPFLLLVDQTRLLDSNHYGGDHVVYAAKYFDEASFESINPEQYEDEASDALATMEHQDGTTNLEIFWKKTFVYKHATPVYRAGFGKLIEKLPRKDGVFMTGMPFIYPDSRNVNTMIRTANRVSQEIIKFCGIE